MRKRGLIGLLDDCHPGHAGARKGERQRMKRSRSNPAPRSESRSRSVKAGGLEPPRYVQPSAKYHARHFDHGGSVTLSVTALGLRTYRPFATRSDFDLRTAPQMSRSSSATRSMPFYVEPFDTSAPKEMMDATGDPSLADRTGSVTPGEGESGTVGKREPNAPGQVEVGGKATPMPTRANGGSDSNPTTPADAEKTQDFESDLRRIIEEKKRYENAQRTDPTSTVEAAPARPTESAPAQEERPKDEHAIFERIAQSMKLANAYDLGTVALNQRFDAFDREMDARAAREARVRPAQPPQRTTEFLEDIDEIHRAGGRSGMTPNQTASANESDDDLDGDDVPEGMQSPPGPHQGDAS